MTPEEHYKIYKAKSKPEIRRAIAQLSGGISEVEIARLALEDKQMEEQAENEKERLKLQHDLNKEIIEIQNEFNGAIFKKQRKLTILVTIVTLIMMLIASLSAVYLGYMLPQKIQIEKQEQMSQQIIERNTKTSTSDIHHVQKPYKVP